ncbi:hypothetical protein Nepgr_031311 [Nepenthes gracilis]|uniref:Uncharacterized protein n=1 Tax=Nepenthes gracilis TaxID=150966 RepID=A0AAD3TI73_NEPGR|nr:hypothetical protein Nepgr_031311 [Nepenthes gracilis]
MRKKQQIGTATSSSNRAAANWSVEQANLGRSANFVTHQLNLGSVAYQAFSRNANHQHTALAAKQATPVDVAHQTAIG